MGVTINKKSTKTEPPPYNRQQTKPPGDSAVVEVQEMFSLHRSLLTNAMYHHGKYSNQINTS